jgi:hypothetical protein
MTSARRIVPIVGFVAAVAATAGGVSATPRTTDGLPQGGEPVNLSPADFTTRIDNRYWPMRPGSRWVYRATDPAGTQQRVVVTVTDRTKQLANGITARIVTDVGSEGGTPVEVTDDYFAQDREGNIWYMGEATTEYENGRPASTAGSFEAGVDGAQPGIAMPAKPKVGLRYRQEYLRGQAEDRAVVFGTGEQVGVPFGHFKRGSVLMTKDLNPLEPRAVEYKFYARGVGPVLSLGISGGSEREELVSFRR